MLLQILDIIAPVFLVIGAGYMAARGALLNREAIDGLMRFAIQVAVPCLLFEATRRLDLQQAYDGGLMLGFFAAASLCFFIAYAVARTRFQRRPGEAVAVAFGALFSNTLLMGLPISERAFGADSLAPNYAILSIHAPFCYFLGTVCMECWRADGRSWRETAQVVLKTMFRNSLMLAILLGFAVNLSGLPLPQALLSAVDILGRAALPVALFALGGVLTRYRLGDTLGEASSIVSLSLFLHPALCWALCMAFAVPEAATRSAVLMAAMSPGLNAYLFASLYQRGQETAASVVVLGTGGALFSVSAWLWILGV